MPGTGRMSEMRLLRTVHCCACPSLSSRGANGRGSGRPGSENAAESSAADACESRPWAHGASHPAQESARLNVSFGPNRLTATFHGAQVRLQRL